MPFFWWSAIQHALCAGVFAAGVAFGVPVGHSEVYDPAGNTWTTVGTLATARSRHAAVVLASGQVWIVGLASWGLVVEVMLRLSRVFL